MGYGRQMGELGSRAISILGMLYLCATPALAFEVDEPLLWGGKISIASDCPDGPSFVVAESGAGTECIRYFSAGLGEVNPVVIVVLEGDRDSEVDRAPTEIPGNTYAKRKQYAHKLHARVKLPLILLARPGTYGSTGNHRHKRTRKEFVPISAALDQLKRRYGIERWIIVGHSGGGTAAAAMMTLGRNDLRCVIITSGAFDLVERANRYRKMKGLPLKENTDLTGTVNPYDPLYQLHGVVRDPSRTVYVLGNPNDKITPFEFQKSFADRLLELGHRVELAFSPAFPPNYHDLTFGSGLNVANECAAGQ